MKSIISITCDPDRLCSYADEMLVALLHANSISEAPFGDPFAEDFGDKLVHEMARRWLKAQEPSIWKRQGRHIEAAAHFSPHAESGNKPHAGSDSRLAATIPHN